VLLHALWPAAARRLGVVTPIAALVVLVLVPITVNAGEALETMTGVTPQIQRHADLGNGLLPWVIALFVVALAEWAWTGLAVRFAAERFTPGVRLAVRVVLAVAAVVVAVGTTWDVVLIGDAGARAVWGGLGG
jgi:hypothetical protein